MSTDKPEGKVFVGGDILGPKDPLYPLIEKEAALYVPIHGGEAFDLFPSLENRQAYERRGVSWHPNDLDEKDRGKIELPDGLNNQFMFFHISIPKSDFENGLKTHTVIPEYFDTLPDFVSPKIGLCCSETMRDHIMRYDPELAYFHPHVLLNSVTNEPTKQPYFTMIPRYVLFCMPQLRKNYDLGSPSCDYINTRDNSFFILTVEGAFDQFGAVPFIRDAGFNRDLFISMKKAGLTGLIEIPYGREYPKEKETIGHGYR